MNRIAPREAFFMLLESAEHPLHVAALQLFERPVGSGRAFERATYEAMRAWPVVTPAFRGHPVSTRRGTSTIRWTDDNEVDIDYHLRWTVLPEPGGDRELFALISELHGSSLDRRRPLWEVHVIGGLEGDRFAIYAKIHHAIVDGLAGMRLIQRSLSTDRHDHRARVPWSAVPARGADSGRPRQSSGESSNEVKSVASLRSALSTARVGLRERQLIPPFRAPRTVFNDGGLGARRCAVRSWPLCRIKGVAGAAGVTVNDVVLAMAAGSLRAYLTEANALPSDPLIAMVPVTLRNEDDALDGNIAGAALCSLATHVDDPRKRLDTIHASMHHAKRVARELPRSLAMTWAGFLVAPISGDRGLGTLIPPLFNIGFSNVLGTDESLYYNGARLAASYPLVPFLRGQTLNFALATTADSLDLGIVGCGRAAADLERLLEHLETSLKDLERAVGR